MESIGNALQGMKERLEANKELSRKREEEYYASAFIQLPLWQSDKRGTPNSFLRSALFAAIQSKDRIYLDRHVLFSQKGNKIIYTGQQLNQEDLTIWLALIEIMKEQPLGTECTFTSYGLLKRIGFQTGGEQHDLLHETIIRLNACVLEIDTESKTYFGSLIEGGERDKKSGEYKIIIRRELIKLFQDNDWTALDWNTRALLKRKPLALKLHGYYSSHEKPLPVSVDFLFKLTSSKNKQKADFKRQLKTALEDLIKIDFLKSYSIEEDMVSVERVHKKQKVIESSK